MSSARAGRRLRPVQRERLTDQAHAAIREAITSGHFALGEHLTETQLAADLQMSRAPVREALQRLSNEGLVEERPHQGTFVVELTADDVVDFYNARLGIETTAVRLFMHRGASTAPLHKRVSEMERAAERDDINGVVRAELGFHRVICEGGGNELLLRLFTEIEGRLLLVMAMDDRGFERLRDVALEHEPVVAAIEAGNATKAAVAMERHILSTVGDLIERLGGQSSGLLSPLR